jgi:hypothetical protein
MQIKNDVKKKNSAIEAPIISVSMLSALASISSGYNIQIAAYDKVRKEANMMSDALVDGIVKQFPNEFSNTSIITTSSPSFLPLQQGI